MSAWASDDLASVIIRPDLEFAGWGQGVIEFWNPETFENRVQYRGSQHENLPVASGVEALTYQPGDVVMLSRWQPTGGGATTLRIGAGGRVIVPGTGAAEKAVTWMTTALASRLARKLLGEATHVAQVATFESQGHTDTWDDLATPGPTVSNVEIGESGTALVILSARIDIGFGWGDDFFGAILMNAAMGLEITGATSRPPDPWSSLEKGGNVFADAGDVVISDTVNTSKVLIVRGLNPGLHTFTAKYRTRSIPPENTFGLANYSDRLLAVLPL